LVDTQVAAAALEHGVVALALTAHTTGLRRHGWNGLLLGYAQVDAGDTRELACRSGCACTCFQTLDITLGEISAPVAW
jgi:hypothetical protein